MPLLPEAHPPFRLTEKHFKNRATSDYPSLYNQSIIDLSRPPLQEDDEVWQAGWWAVPDDTSMVIRRKKGKERARGERPEAITDGLREITLKDGKTGWIVAEGCILIPRYLDAESQLNLLEQALWEYTTPPNPLSLSTHYSIPPNLFHLYATDSQELIQPLHQPPSSGHKNDNEIHAQPTNGSSRTRIETEPGSVMGYEEILSRTKSWKGDIPSDKALAKTAGVLMKELRWANLGWVYRWTTKAYDFTPERPVTFPEGLKGICKGVVGDVPWDEVFTGAEDVPPDYENWREDYVPDTGIVNYYQMKDTLMGHVDRAELDPARPLVSLSLGHTCIFLLGSSTRSVPPKPIILRSGDILIMSGKGRQAYHGVPRIMEDTLPTHFATASSDSDRRSAIKRWISTARVNINVRQVFPPGFERPKSG